MTARHGQPASRDAVYYAIDTERAYQAKWEDPLVTDSGGKHSQVEFLAYIQDYVTEALHFATRNPDPKALEFCLHSMRKIAALAVASMEQHGAPPRVIVDLGGLT